MHRRFSERRLIWLAPLVGALAIGVFPAVAGAATTPATSCTAIPASHPCYTAAPAITAPAGQPPTEVTSPQVGRYLAGNPGTWTPPQPYPSVQWTYDCHPTAVPAVPGTPIPRAINKSYQIADSDVGHTLCVVVDTGGVEAITAPTGTVAPGPPLNQTAPTISGPTVQGQTLTATPGTWRGTGATTGGITFAYQWKRCNSTGGVCGKPFTPPSSSPTYVLQQGDVGHTMQVWVIATNSAGSTPAGAKHATALITAPSTTPPPGNPPGKGGSSNNNANGGGQNSGQNGGQGGSPSSGNVANIHALLVNALAVRGNGGRIRALVKQGGYSFSFTAPSAGRLVISWYHATKPGKKVLVATATVLFQKTGTATVKLLLTGKGRRLLTGVGKMKLTAKGAFTPVGKATTRARRVITLKP
jgi:hypothetical protein